jgi:hypothetical protein
MQKIDLTNIGVVTDTVDDYTLSKIHAELAKIKVNMSAAETYNSDLAGNIEREFKLKDCHADIEKIVIPLAEYHEQEYPCRWLLNKSVRRKGDAPPKLWLSSVWANFQQKHEFNPMHTHSGIYSFVIWIKIPFDRNEELQKAPGRRSSDPKAGAFEFVYPTSLGTVMSHQFPMAKDLEGKIVLFPAMLSHQVYPFYTADGYRISVSGNLFFT